MLPSSQCVQRMNSFPRVFPVTGLQVSDCPLPPRIMMTLMIHLLIVTLCLGSSWDSFHGIQPAGVGRLFPPTRASQHREIPNQFRAGASVASPTSFQGVSYYARVALAGGLAGATGTTVLYPMDTAKMLRQSNPTQFTSVRSALVHLIGASGAYRGWLPAALGAIPSSALYFGAYESSKRALEQRFGSTKKKWWIHGIAAATGNTISSAIFVPKEVLKQQLQYRSSATFQQVLWEILQQKGVRGLYAGYQATLMRNIPSAMVRFVLYEELKQWWSETGSKNQILPPPVGLFAAGAVAGAVASGIMTPVDVIKTRLATGTCPIGVRHCVQHVVTEMGWKGLYVGAGSRMMWSGAFSAIGFGTFELVKDVLGVSSNTSIDATVMATKKARTATNTLNLK